MSSANLNNLFFKIFRDVYLKQVISQLKCCFEISVSLEYLKHNYKDLQRLDTLNYNIDIYVALTDEDNDYLALGEAKDVITKLLVSDDLGPILRKQIMENLPKNLKSIQYSNNPQQTVVDFGSNIQELRIDYRQDNSYEEIKKNTFPNTVKTLDLNGYNTPFTVDSLPDSLTHLKLSLPHYDYYNKSQFPTNLPISLDIGRDLTERPVFNKQWNLRELSMTFVGHVVLLPNDIPSTVETLSLYGEVGELQENVIPSSVTDLTIHEYNFKLKPNVLPSKLKLLNFYEYDHPLEAGILPNGLRELHLIKYNQPIGVNAIPSSIRFIKMSTFNQDLLPGTFSNCVNLKTLLIPQFVQTLESPCFPDSLTTLMINHLLDIPGADYFPASLIELQIDQFDGSKGSFDKIPERIKTLFIDFVDEEPEDNAKITDQAKLPQHITYLKLGYCVYIIPSTFIPVSVKKLSVGIYMTVINPPTPGESIYPPHLEFLTVPDGFARQKLPQSLKILHLNDAVLEYIDRTKM